MEEAEVEESLVSLFDKICFLHGEQDAILNCHDSNTASSSCGYCYLELQELSRLLAAQLVYRYRPDYVLIECFGHVVAEAVSVLACMRCKIPFVPVDLLQGGGGGLRLSTVVNMLRNNNLHHNCRQGNNNIVAICCCQNDQDPVLGVFYQADVHTILFVDTFGNMLEQIAVPTRLPENLHLSDSDDDLYVLFTSGTSTGTPKAVVGSHRSTYRRFKWFRDTFEPSERIGRRTSLAFVDGITELLGTLLHPPSLLLAVHPDHFKEQGILALLEHKPTQLTLLPSQLSQMLLLPKERLHSLQRIIVSGEPVTQSLWTRFQQKMLPQQCQLINLYGQTESTGDVLCADLTKLDAESNMAVVDGIVAVGSPILPTIHVSTNANNELIVKGNLSNGYLGRPRFTSFATGDVGFCCSKDHHHNSVWYVKGRCDDVQKINGIWTSPSEVEAAFLQMYPVQQSIAAVIINDGVYVVSEETVAHFSREQMRQAGYPWNLIPKQVFCHAIPKRQTAAGKVDRVGLRLLVCDLLRGAAKTPKQDDDADNDLRSMVADVLMLSHLDETKSFAELGGDSASAVTLLYKIKFARPCPANFTAATILTSSSVSELNRVLDDGNVSTPKRLKVERKPTEKQFVPLPIKRYSERHVAVPFKACVDASPTKSVDGTAFFVGCQGGVVQKISSETGQVLACRHCLGYKIQADCLAFADCVIVSAYSRTGRGMVVSLCLDLQQVIWKREFDSCVKTTPVLMGSVDLCIVLGDQLRFFDLQTGASKHSITLSDSVVTKPAVSASGDVAVFASDSCLFRVERMPNGNFQKVDLFPVSYTTIGAVKKDLSTASDSVLISGSFGSVYRIGFNAMEGSCMPASISDYPLSSAVGIGEAGLIVGSYDGLFHYKDKNEAWDISVGACIYARPLVLPDGSFVVCTSAGDVVQIVKGRIVWRYRIDAEIWSGPSLVGSNRIAFGARDSRVHLITFG